MSQLPPSIDRMPIEQRKPRAGPLLDPDEVIACSLNGITHEWWRHMPLSASSIPVREVLNGLRLAGYKIEPK
jgi:hypothetical protein